VSLTCVSLEHVQISRILQTLGDVATSKVLRSQGFLPRIDMPAPEENTGRDHFHDKASTYDEDPFTHEVAERVNTYVRAHTDLKVRSRARRREVSSDCFLI
jgi:hypothetical protein